MNQPLQAASPFGWVDDERGDGTRVPIVGFDFETVFNRMDGEVSEATRTPKPTPLSELLSPRELHHALAVAKAILRRSSPRSRATRATWRNPEIRARRIAGLLRSMQTRDRQQLRESMLRHWRERRPELLAKIRAFTRDPEYRRRASVRFRARWANPVMRQKMLAYRLSLEGRMRISITSRRYYREHPEARQRAAERARAMWRDPVYRARRNRALPILTCIGIFSSLKDKVSSPRSK